MAERAAWARGGGFPTTRLSAVEAARSQDPEQRRRALELLIAAYWKPVYKHVRLRHGRAAEDARDLTQELFARLVEKGFLDAFDPRRGRLRTFLRVCTDRLVMNESRDARRAKRGGGRAPLSLDWAGAEGELGCEPRTEVTPETLFEREWARSVLTLGVDALRELAAARGRQVAFALFERCDLEPGADARPSYRQLAEQHELTVTQVTNHLAWARRELRRLTLERLRAMTASDDEYRREARSLLGVEPP